MVRLQDEPIADPVCIPVYYVSKLARDNGVIVCQVGEGADELFWGYPSWKTLLGLQRYDDLPVPRRAEARRASAPRLAAGQGGRREVEYLRRGGARPADLLGRRRVVHASAQKQRLLSPRLRGELDGLTSWDAIAPIRDRFEAKALGARRT